MRRLPLLLIAFVVSLPVQAQDKGKPKIPDKETFLHPELFKVGQVGLLSDGPGRGPWVLKVSQVLDKERAVFVLPAVTFVALMPTADLAEGSKVKMAGYWHIRGTTKVGSRTLFELEPVK